MSGRQESASVTAEPVIVVKVTRVLVPRATCSQQVRHLQISAGIASILLNHLLVNTTSYVAASYDVYNGGIAVAPVVPCGIPAAHTAFHRAGRNQQMECINRRLHNHSILPLAVDVLARLGFDSHVGSPQLCSVPIRHGLLASRPPQLVCFLVPA
jgi:hypothetical protein